MSFTAIIMDYMENWLRTPAFIGATALGAAFVFFVIFKITFQKKKDLCGKVVVITGASSGIGQALAYEFVKRNCRVILAARSLDKLNQVKQDLVELFKVDENSVTTFYLDLEDDASIAKACQSIIEVYGKIDLLINNAGVSAKGAVVDTDLDTYKKVMNVNYFAQIAVTKAFLPHMISQGGGTVVAVSSLQGRFTLPISSAYGASKHALQAFCDSLRHENRNSNIDVVVVSPGYVATSLATLSPTGGKMSGRRKERDSGMSPQTCAGEIILAIEYNETDYLIGRFHHRVVVYVRVLCPWLYNFIMRHR